MGAIAPCPLDQRPDLAFDPGQAMACVIVGVDVFLQYDQVRRMLEAQGRQPDPVLLGPVAARAEHAVVAQQKAGELLARAVQIAHRPRPRPLYPDNGRLQPCPTAGPLKRRMPNKQTRQGRAKPHQTNPEGKPFCPPDFFSSLFMHFQAHVTNLAKFGEQGGVMQQCLTARRAP